jgi:hypothetical protein
MWHAWVERETCTLFWWENTQRKETTRKTKKLIDGIRMDLRKTGWGWTGFDWLRIGTGGELL